MRITFLRIIASLLLLASCGPQESDWSQYHESQLKKPYGTQVFYEQLDYLFPNSATEKITKRTDEYLTANSFEYGTYLYINPTFYPNDKEYTQISELLTVPNDVFISTQDEYAPCFTGHGIKLAYNTEPKFVLRLKRLLTDDYKFTIPNRTPLQTFYFEKIPSYATILGTIEINGKQQPNYIGIYNNATNSTLLLHSQPQLYSNYHLLRDQDGKYALNTLSHINHNSYFIWDGYGTKRRYNTPASDGDSESLLRYIYTSKPLTYSLLTLLLLGVLFFTVNYKRVVRPMPILRPVKNNSLDYVTVIAALFESEANKIRAAQYRANYVLDRIREKYYLDTSDLGDELLNELAIKSEVQPQRLASLIYQLKKAKTLTKMSSDEFREFNKEIEAAFHLIKLNQ